MSDPIVQTNTPGDWLKGESEIHNLYSREEELLDGTAIAPTDPVTLGTGIVLGKITASGKLVPCDPNAVDGSQVAYGLLVYDTDVPVTTDTKAAVIVRQATVDKKHVTFGAGFTTQPQKDNAFDELAAAGIISREGITEAADPTLPLP